MIAGDGGKFTSNQARMKIEDDGDLLHFSGAIPLPFIPLNKILRGQCLSSGEISQAGRIGTEEASASEVKMHYTVTAMSKDGKISRMQTPVKLKLVENFRDLGRVEDFSTTRGDKSSSEASSTNSDNDEIDEQPHFADGNIYFFYCDVSDKDESPAHSLEESIPNKAAATGKQQRAAKSKTKQQKVSKSVVEPIKKTAYRNLGACALPQLPTSDSEGTQAMAAVEGSNDLHTGGLYVAPVTSSLLHSRVDGTKSCSWAEETCEHFHNISASRYQSSQGHGDSTGATTISVGEPPPENQVHQDEHDVAVFLAEPVTFPSGAILYLQQIFGVEPQPPLQPKVWHMHYPVPESEEGQKGPSQLVP